MTSFLSVARSLALQASALLLSLRGTALQESHKPDHSLVTNADHEADAIISQGLRAAFPDHSILTEESGLSGSQDAEYVWIVDPLDGTRAFARGRSGFSVMIGLLRKGAPFAGVVVDPLDGWIYEAERGAGCYVEHGGKRVRMRVSARQEAKEMRLVTSTGFPERWQKALQVRWPGPWRPAINSVGIKAGIVVRQEADLYINHQYVHYWDTVAPQIIVEEAGGRFTCIDGQPLTYDLGGPWQHRDRTLASNGQRHEEMLADLRKIFL